MTHPFNLSTVSETEGWQAVYNQANDQAEFVGYYAASPLQSHHMEEVLAESFAELFSPNHRPHNLLQPKPRLQEYWANPPWGD